MTLACVLHDGVRLAPLETGDAGALIAHLDESRAHLRPWLPELDSIASFDDAAGFLAENARTEAAGSGVSYGLWCGARLAGVVGIGAIDRDAGTATIGYWLGADFVGRGLATAAVAAVIDHAFGTLRLRRVEITCPADNPRSRAIPERLGFTPEGTRRAALWLHGRPVDDVIYGLLAPEWASRARLV